MLVLGIDTTTRAGSCAIVRDGELLREMAGDPDRPHDVRLPGDLMMLLDHQEIALGEIDVYSVATGPGSFTGLRIGIATMQGLAFAAGKPLVGVSGFDASARIAGSRDRAVERARRPELVATWVDAWRGEVYAALYEDGRQIEAPTVEHPDVLLARYLRHVQKDVPFARKEGSRLVQHDDPSISFVFIGDAAHIYRNVILRTFGEIARIAEPAAPLLAGTIAKLATESARAGHLPPPHAIRPLYVRRPDAELARDARPVR
jgi:tRNA threonylcarbamoyladenosine biosynthesis protein TsaB